MLLGKSQLVAFRSSAPVSDIRYLLDNLADTAATARNAAPRCLKYGSQCSKVASGSARNAGRRHRREATARRLITPALPYRASALKAADLLTIRGWNPPRRDGQYAHTGRHPGRTRAASRTPPTAGHRMPTAAPARGCRSRHRARTLRCRPSSATPLRSSRSWRAGRRRARSGPCTSWNWPARSGSTTGRATPSCWCRPPTLSGPCSAVMPDPAGAGRLSVVQCLYGGGGTPVRSVRPQGCAHRIVERGWSVTVEGVETHRSAQAFRRAKAGSGRRAGVRLRQQLPSATSWRAGMRCAVDGRDAGAHDLRPARRRGGARPARAGRRLAGGQAPQDAEHFDAPGDDCLHRVPAADLANNRTRRSIRRQGGAE
ncbi:UNVERIFIED_ORG: hypothetical protein CLV66_11645 [Actinomadura viridilutea]